MKKLDKTVKTGMLASTLENCIRYAREESADALHPWIGGLHGFIPENMTGMPIRAWNSEEPFFEDGRVLKEGNLLKYSMFGVTDIFTNVPELYLGEEL